MVIKPLNESGYTDFINLINLSFDTTSNDSDDYITSDILKSEIDKETLFFCLYDDDELFVGTVGVVAKSVDSYKLVRLAVHPGHRHKGYGKLLVKHIEDTAILKGGSHLSLGFLNDNAVLKDWYISLGFNTDKVKSYKNGTMDICFAKKALPIRPSINLMNKRKLHCDICGFPTEVCMCGLESIQALCHKFVILMHPFEAPRPTNTGFLIKNTFPDSTDVFYWDRSFINPKLKKLLSSDKYHKILVFPPDAEQEKTRAIEGETIKTIVKSYDRALIGGNINPKKDKPILFIILDGTWKEARKMARKSEYLEELKMLTFDSLLQTNYTLRRNKDLGHICTVEVAIEILKLIGECDKASGLTNYFNLFLERYDEGKRL